MTDLSELRAIAEKADPHLSRKHGITGVVAYSNALFDFRCAFKPGVALALVAVAEAAQAAFDQPHIAASAAMKPVRTALAALEAALKETR